MRLHTLYIATAALLISSCSLEENSPYLSSDEVYSDSSKSLAALNGVYEKMADYAYFDTSLFYVTNLNSGFFVTTKNGKSNTNVHNLTICSLDPTSGDNEINSLWGGIYTAISRANDIIENLEPQKGEILSVDQIKMNCVIGQAYFIRAFSYFNLVRLWGEVPLRIKATTATTTNLKKSTELAIYDQILDDAFAATGYMDESLGEGYPRPYAANMLLAKIFMQIATSENEALRQGKTEEYYWQAAYDQAIEVYGKYSLLPRYDDLWCWPSGENSAESIFEIQYSSYKYPGITRLIQPNGWFDNVDTWGNFLINAELYDSHITTYPTDPRIASTFLTTYQNYATDATVNFYPVQSSRASFTKAFPLPYKFMNRDRSASSLADNRNIVVYRYADLLLMLAEISNELQNGEQKEYVTEVLQRSNLVLRSEYNGDKDAFREAIMEEYRFELFAENQDWFNNRRRGYIWFKEHVIDPHNNYANFVTTVDVTHSTNKDEVMRLPMPSDEINTNQLIDQTEGVEEVVE